VGTPEIRIVNGMPSRTTLSLLLVPATGVKVSDAVSSALPAPPFVSYVVIVYESGTLGGDGGPFTKHPVEQLAPPMSVSALVGVTVGAAPLTDVRTITTDCVLGEIRRGLRFDDAELFGTTNVNCGVTSAPCGVVGVPGVTVVDDDDPPPPLQAARETRAKAATNFRKPMKHLRS
jgi:hypothetical protein